MPNIDIERQRPWNGLACGEEERNKAAQEVFNRLAASPKNEDYSTLVCGDMMIVGYKHDKTNIEIADCIIRRRTSYSLDGKVLY